jgi:polyphosphate kinase 2 (PPK2 family)
VLFDRRWYNGARGERVMGFAPQVGVETFLRCTPVAARASLASGVVLVSHWLEMSRAYQTDNYQERGRDPRKLWRLSPIDLEPPRRRYDFSRARDATFAAGNAPESPWWAVDANDQRRSHLSCTAHLLSLIPYEDVPREPVRLPERRPPGDDVEPRHPFRRIPKTY